MPKNPDYGNLLFLDIETVGQFPDYESGDESYRSFWDQKWSVLNRNQDEGDDMSGLAFMLNLERSSVFQ